MKKETARQETTGKRILVGFIMDGKAGGIDTYLLHFLDEVWEEGMEIDFLTDEISPELKKKLETYHSDLFQIASLRRPLTQYRQVCEIIQNKPYDMAYFNVSTAIDCIAAFAAKKMKVPERILHSHSSGNDCESVLQRTIYNVVHRICKPFFYKAGTRLCGCSKKAGYWLFPKRIVESPEFEVVFNAVDRERFSYNEELRSEVRKELAVEDKFVVGHLGNFCYAKNYPFLIQVFREIRKRQQNAVLLLAGKGIELEEVKNMVHKEGLDESVRFLGWRRDTNRLYNAMDVFVLPSRFEGLPVVGVEAQSARLVSVLSSSITPEAKIQDHCYFLDLKDGPEKWAEFILGTKGTDRNCIQMLEEAKNYDLSVQNEQLKRLVWH